MCRKHSLIHYCINLTEIQPNCFSFFILVMIVLDTSTHLLSKLFKKAEHSVPGAPGIDFAEVCIYSII